MQLTEVLCGECGRSPYRWTTIKQWLVGIKGCEITAIRCPGCSMTKGMDYWASAAQHIDRNTTITTDGLFRSLKDVA